MKKGLLALFLLVPTFASAHAFGQQYTLPLPLSFYFTGATLALLASFLILGFFSTPTETSAKIERTHVIRFRGMSYVSRGLGFLGVLGLSLTLLLAFFGDATVLGNPVPILFWVILLLGVTYASTLIRGLWERMNPFRHITEFVLGSDYPPILAYPEKAGYVPALLLYFGLIWMEILSFGVGAIPFSIGIALLLYLLISLFGSGLFGVATWFRFGDFFGVLFDVIGKFAPLQLTKEGVSVTLPGERLVAETVSHITLLLFILFMLSSTAFDGLKDTAPWMTLFTGSDFLLAHYTLVSYALLILSPFLFLALYSVAIGGMKAVTQKKIPFTTLLLRFGFSLVPIAIAYHFAHYFTLLLTEGQKLIPMLSDPLGKGWDLFGTASYAYNVGIIGAGTVWYAEVTAIVVGHIIATYIAHRIALLTFSSRRDVLLGQLPMLLLMVLYTVCGLWILSLPFGTGSL